MPRGIAPLDAALTKTTHNTESARALLRSEAFRQAEELLNQLQEKTVEQRRKEEVRAKGVKQSIYLGYINRELTSEAACLELPLTLCLLLTFSVFAILLLRQDQILSIEDAIKFDIEQNANFAFAGAFGHKNLKDVNSIADLWSWTRLGYLPLIVQPFWPYAEGYPASLGTAAYDGTAYGAEYGNIHGQPFWLFDGSERPAPVKNDYLRYTRLIGGIRLQQTIAEVSFETCVVPHRLDRGMMMWWLGKPCYQQDGGVLTPEIQDVENFNGFTRVEWLLPEFDDLQELTRALVDMEDGCSHAATVGELESCRCTSCRLSTPPQPYVDERTARVEYAFIAYNPQYGVYSYIGTNLIFNSGGHIHKIINAMSAWASVFAMPMPQFVVLFSSGIVWVLTLAKIVVGEVLEMVSVVRNSKLRWWKAIWKDYIGFWNLVDWASLAFSIVLLMVFMTSQSRISSANANLELMMGASERARLGTISRGEYKRLTEDFFAVVQSMMLSEKVFRIIVVFYPFILMMRLFKSFAAQPRLAIVAKTLSRASEDLLHFGIVFFSVFFCLTMNSVLFFGQDIEDFSTLPRAINGCFRAMFGDWDYASMQEVGLLKAQMWFWSFMLLMVLMLLNMLLAVIMDAYTAEKGRANTAQSLIAQTRDIYRRIRQYRRGERVRLNEIWKVFEKEFDGDVKAMLAEDRLITASWLTEIVPKLQEKQARRTLENSLAAFEDALEAEITDESRLRYISDQAEKCEDRARVMLEELQYMTNRVQYYDRLQAHGDPEYDFHFGGEDVSEAQASQEAVSNAVTGLSQEVCNLFVDNLKRIEAWQDNFERQQNELHGLVADMQIMVRQQAWCIAAMSEAVSQLGHEGDSLGLSSVAAGE